MYIKRFVKHYYIMLIPALLWLFFFSIVPMFGIVMAFQDYNPGQGILHSKFVGLENFKYMFQMNDVKQVLCNTVVIAVGKIIGNIIFPLIFALLLNEFCIKRLKRPIQTIVYLPYFLSWVILAKIVLNIFGYTGPINQLMEAFGRNPINFFGEPSLFQPLVIGTDIWKGFGYNTVVYLAAILGVDQSLYEAAAADGAGRFKRIWHITLPGIRTTVALLAILSLGNVLNAGFDQIYNLYNLDCQHFFRQIFLGYFSDIVQAFDTLRKNVCGDDYTSLHNPIVLSSVLPAYGMFHSIQILFL